MLLLIKFVGGKKVKETTKRRAKIAINIIEWVIIGFILLLLVFILIFANKPNKNSSGSLFGYETRLVLSDSMNASDDFYKDKNYSIKSIKAGDAIFISDVDYQNAEKREKFFADLKVGDIITYQSLTYHVVITHRIVEITPVSIGEKEDINFTIQGDNVEKSEYSQEIISKSSGLIIGKVVHKSSFVGWVYNSFLNNKPLVFSIVIIPCVIGVGLEVFKIVKIIREPKLEKEKQNKIEAEKNRINKEKEIEDLKKQLEELKNKNKSE